MLGCIPSPKFRVIHRSLLFDAIEEHKQTPLREDQEEKEPLLRQILEALKAKEEKTQIDEPSENIVDEDKEGKNTTDISKNKVEKEGNIDENKEETNEEQEKSSAKKETNAATGKFPKIVAALEKIEQVHREQGEDLLEANEDLKDPGVAKVSKMEEKIRKVKENLGPNEKKDDLHLLDQPNALGKILKICI